MRFRDVVTVVRPGSSPSPDGGDPLPNWATATTTDYAGELQPLTTTELVVAAERTDSTHRVFLPSDAERWRARGRIHHIELRVFRITGG
jgi:hypothetical protein